MSTGFMEDQIQIGIKKSIEDIQAEHQKEEEEKQKEAERDPKAIIIRKKGGANEQNLKQAVIKQRKSLAPAPDPAEVQMAFLDDCFGDHPEIERWLEDAN